MKRIIIALAACLTLLSSCNYGKLSGETETKTIGVPCTFSTLQVTGNARFMVNNLSNVVTITADKKLVNCVKVKGTDKKLKIDVTNKKILAAGKDAVVIYIPVSRKLDCLKFNGSSMFEFPELVMVPNVKFETKGSNVFRGVLTLEKLSIKSEGSEKYEIDLNCDYVKIDGNGSSVFGTRALPLLANEAEIDLKGSCVAYVEAPGKCRGTVDGNSELFGCGDHDYHKVKTLAAGKVTMY